jgi:integrase/recombinase XerD
MPRPRAIRRLRSGGKKKAPVLNPKQLKRLLYVAGDTRNPERNQLIVWLLFGAGFRITEVAAIEIKDVLWKSGKLKNNVIIPAKYCKNNRAGHVFFYHNKLLAALERYIQLRVTNRLMMSDTDEFRRLKKDSKVILSENKRPYSLKQKKRIDKEGNEKIYFACDTLQTMVTEWGREAGIDKFTTHSGRRTMATRVARSGGNDDLLCMLLRHESDDMPYEYIDADILGIRRTLEALYTIDDDELDTEVV